MGYTFEFPGEVSEETAAEAQVLDAAARCLYYNIDTGEFYQRFDVRSALSRYTVKRGDTVPIRLYIVNEEQDVDAEIIQLPEGAMLALEARVGPGAAKLVECTEWEKGTDHRGLVYYEGIVDCGSVPLNTAIGYGTANELPRLELLCDLAITADGSEISSGTITLVVQNDIRRATGESPQALGFLASGVQFAYWITGLTGGTNTDLDGQATLSLEAGNVLVVLVRGENPPDTFMLVTDPDPGVTVADGVNVVQPADYNYDPDPIDPDAYVENIKLWVRKE